jgi:hypothetical protein
MTVWKPDNKIRKKVMATMLATPKDYELPAAKRKILTDREMKFVEVWLTAAGRLSMREAAIEAGYPPGSASSAATKLTDPKKSPHVLAFMKQRHEEINAKYLTTYEQHMQDLKMIRDRALEAGQYGAAVQAEYRRGQALGTIYIDRKEIRHGTIDSMSKDEVQKRLEELKRLYTRHGKRPQIESEVVDVEESGRVDVQEDEGGDEEDDSNEGGIVGESRDS